MSGGRLVRRPVDGCAKPPGRRLSILSRLGLLLVISWLGSGCASFGGSFGALVGAEPDGKRARAKRPVPKLRIERPERSADYDVLVGEFAQADGEYERAREAYQRAAVKDPESAFVHERLARLAWQLEDLEAAVSEAELAFELDPESVRIRLFLGRLYRLGRDFEGLDRVLRDPEGRPLDSDSAYALFQVALERRDLVEAEGLARQLDEAEPDQLRGLLGLATVAEQRGQFDEAVAIVRRGLDRFPDHFLLYMRLAGIERSRDNQPAEIAVYREVLESHPGHYGILQRLGQAQLDSNDLEGALVTYDEIVRTYPDDLDTLRRLASLEFSAGRYSAAANRIEGVLARAPDQPELVFALGQIRRALGDDASAMETFERIEEDAPNYLDARLQIAGLLESEGRVREALDEIEVLRAAKPNRALDFHASTLRVRLGDVSGAIEVLEALLDGSEDDLEVIYQIGVVYGTAGDDDRALGAMQEVLALDPNNAEALNYIGYSWADQGINLDEAEELIRRALELSPGDGYITDSLGWVYYKMAEGLFAESRKDEALDLLDRAQEQLLQASELTGGDSVVSEHLGDVFLLRGDKQGALDYYEEAVGLEVRESEQPNLLDKLERLRSDLDRPSSAGRGSSKGRGRAPSGGAP